MKRGLSEMVTMRMMIQVGLLTLCCFCWENLSFSLVKNVFFYFGRCPCLRKDTRTSFKIAISSVRLKGVPVVCARFSVRVFFFFFFYTIMCEGHHLVCKVPQIPRFRFGKVLLLPRNLAGWRSLLLAHPLPAHLALQCLQRMPVGAPVTPKRAKPDPCTLATHRLFLCVSNCVHKSHVWIDLCDFLVSVYDLSCCILFSCCYFAMTLSLCFCLTCFTIC